jgi:hypothetical protein
MNAMANTIYHMPSQVPDRLMRRAIFFANAELPDLRKVRREWNSIVFEFMVDEKLPINKLRYQYSQIDKFAIGAFNTILHDQEAETLQKEFCFVFIVYFRNGNNIAGGMEFKYFMDDELFPGQL